MWNRPRPSIGVGDDGIVLLAQIDDAPGELLAHVMDQLEQVGAKNVQLLSSIGRKGRPGHVLLVDIRAADETAVAVLLAGELGIWGYRVLEARHRHFDIRYHETELEVRWAGATAVFPLRFKRILHDGTFLRAKAEHDDLVAIAAQLGARRSVPIATIKAAIETAVGVDEPGARLRVTLDGS